jgi:hypothetical protein
VSIIWVSRRLFHFVAEERDSVRIFRKLRNHSQR